MTSVGMMDRLVTIEQRTTSKSTIGTDTETWSLYRKVWARVRYQRGSEKFVAAQTSAEQAAEVRMWSSSANGVTRDMRLSFDDVYWDIKSVAKIPCATGRDAYVDFVVTVRGN